MSKFKKKSTLLISLILVYLIVSLVLGIYWSITPNLQSNDYILNKYVESEYLSKSSNNVATGIQTTATSIYLLDTLLTKPGGFIYNDKILPGLYLDNMPNWEFGVLEQLRGLTLQMRQTMSRSQAQSQEDANLQYAQTQLNIDASNWIFPAAEDEYRKSIKYLTAYLKSLIDDNPNEGKFYARADNLAKYFEYIIPQLGSLSQRLSASSAVERVNTNLSNDKTAVSNKIETNMVKVKTPWTKIDDVFFEARGTSYALIHILKAIEVDFDSVLKDKNAVKSLQQVIRELEGTQKPIRSPVILNGSGFGMFANHSLVISSYITRAQAALIELVNLLSKG